MEIEVVELEPCKLKVHCQANALEIMDKRAIVQEMFKKAPVPGHRSGKASMDAIRMHYRQQIDDSLKRALAEDAFHAAQFEKKLRVHGAPRFNDLMLDGGKFTCEFEVLTKPDFQIATYKELEVPKPPPLQTVEETTEFLMQDLRVKLGDVLPFSDTDFIQQGDNVILDYEGTIEGVRVDGLYSEGEMITVGQNNIENFDANLLGMKIGESREFDIHIPQSGLPSLSGKTIHFRVGLTTGSKTVPCALDDELAVKLGKKDFVELRQFVGAAAAGRVSNADKMALRDAVAKRLTADNTIEVPNWMALSEAKYLAHHSHLNWDVMPDEDRETFLSMADKNVKLALVLDKIRETEPEAQLSDQEVFDIIKQNLAQTKVDKPIDEVIQEMNKSGYLQVLFSRIRDEHALDFVVKSVKVIE